MDVKEFFITPQGFTDADLKRLEERRVHEAAATAVEGQLAVDVFQTKESIVVRTAVAGVKPEHLHISVHNDVLTIRGERAADTAVNEEDYYYRECYWGAFSRSVVLPVEVQQNKIDAVFKNGILTVTLPKAKPEKSVRVKVED